MVFIGIPVKIIRFFYIIYARFLLPHIIVKGYIHNFCLKRINDRILKAVLKL